MNVKQFTILLVTIAITFLSISVILNPIIHPKYVKEQEKTIAVANKKKKKKPQSGLGYPILILPNSEIKPRTLSQQEGIKNDKSWYQTQIMNEFSKSPDKVTESTLEVLMEQCLPGVDRKIIDKQLIMEWLKQATSKWGIIQKTKKYLMFTTIAKKRGWSQLL